jgi:hypothetical protein
METQGKGKSQEETRVKTQANADEELEEEVMLGPFPLLQASRQGVIAEPVVPPDQTPHTPEPSPQTLDTPASERRNPIYISNETPKSRRELQPSRTQPPVPSSKARILSQDSVTNAN